MQSFFLFAIILTQVKLIVNDFFQNLKLFTVMETKDYQSFSEIPKDVLNDLITVQEAAWIRDSSKHAVWDLIRRGRLTCITIAGRKLVLKSEVENFEAQPPGVKSGGLKKKEDEK